MDKFKLPEEYKQFLHLKEEDFENINKHIEHFEKENKRKKVIRRWVFGIILVVFVIVLVFGLVDLSYLKRIFESKTFVVKDTIQIAQSEINVRISMPIKDKIIIIFESTTRSNTSIIISNTYRVENVMISNGITSITTKYDKRIYLIFEDGEKVINLETLKPME